MNKNVFIATDYFTDYFEAIPSSDNAITDSLKIAFLLYDQVDIDVTHEKSQRISHWVAKKLSNSDYKDDAIQSIRSIEQVGYKFNLDSNFKSSLFVGATYEVLCEKEPAWFMNWPVGILRATELAELIVLYELYCNRAGCEFYTPLNHRILIDKVYYKIKNGFQKNGPAKHLVESIRDNFEKQSKGKVSDLTQDFDDHCSSLCDTLERRPIASQETECEIPRMQHYDRQLLLLPNPSDLSWADIFELRKSPYRQSFLEHLVSDLKFSAESQAKSYLLDHVCELLHKKRPKTVKNVASRIISNIPVPVIGVNPFSVITSIHDTKEEIKELKSFGWIYFVAEANILARG